jgi:hypothetical protein
MIPIVFLSFSLLAKDFQLVFAPNHFESERSVWRTIIQLNIIG